MKTVAVFEAKSRLSEILAAVEHGEEYTVTKHGMPVACIIPAARKKDASTIADAVKLAAHIKATRKGSRLSNAEYREALEEGRD